MLIRTEEVTSTYKKLITTCDICGADSSGFYGCSICGKDLCLNHRIEAYIMANYGEYDRFNAVLGSKSRSSGAYLCLNRFLDSVSRLLVFLAGQEEEPLGQAPEPSGFARRILKRIIR